MGLDNPLHIAIILLVVLLVFGAKRLPELGKSMGEGLRGFKESVSAGGDAPPADMTPLPSSEPLHATPVEQHDAVLSEPVAHAGAAVEHTPVPPAA